MSFEDKQESTEVPTDIHFRFKGLCRAMKDIVEGYITISFEGRKDKQPANVDSVPTQT